ncbi:MAG: LysR family transcriptional regulator [Pseudomonadota bacterium]
MSELEEMRSFVQVVESGSATKAATVRGVAVSAISRRMKDLEARLGVQLIKRTTRKMTLTQEGRSFYERAVRILSDLAEAEAEITHKDARLTGELRVSIPVSFGMTQVAPFLSVFMSAHPDLVVKVDMSDRRVSLVEEGFDVGIRIGRLGDSSLKARKILAFRHVLCAAPAFFKRHGMPTRPDDLKGWPALCYGHLAHPTRWPYVDPAGHAGEVQVDARLEATNGDVLREAGIAGHGVLCEPSFIVHRALEAGTLVPALMDHRWFGMSIYAIYPPTRHVSLRVRRFIDDLVDHFDGAPSWEACLAGARSRPSRSARATGDRSGSP